ncbi:MAG: Rieske 2Fe-2S domain-containing protein [Nitrospirae bacterium]|nr:Rieske 2Fe-2S domain-containing protein [Nitrospirota bacterium]
MAKMIEKKAADDGKRGFLKLLFLTVMGISFGSVIYPIIRYLSPLSQQQATEKVEISKDEVTIGKARFFLYKGSPAVVIQTKSGFTALSAVCTHLGCIVKWLEDKGEFQCPCHAGRFDATGKVLSGPPPNPLPQIAVVESGAKIVIG